MIICFVSLHIILTFISRVNTISETLDLEKYSFSAYNKQLKFHAQFS